MIIFRKTILALTGLFICIFLIAHLGANFLLLLPSETARVMYNNYSATLRGNFFITIVAYVNYACILFHVLYAILVTRKNKLARNDRYAMNASSENSSWPSQNMMLLGSIIFAFIVIHMANFWFKVKFLHQDEDLYQMVYELFKNPYYVLLYSLGMIPLGLHLSHGIQSAFKTLGLYHKKYIRILARVSVIFATFMGLGFAIIPIVLYLR
jgi:succinate dehydrogenase / fumarate reductase cytochrome b subunit